MKVADVMTREVATVPASASLKEVAAVLAERRVSGLPVVNPAGRVLGVISEADILAKERGAPERSRVHTALHPADAEKEHRHRVASVAGEAMTAPALLIEPDRTIAEAAARMLEADVNRLLVVENGRLVGIVSRADLVRAFTRSDEEVAREIREEILLRNLSVAPTRVSVDVRGGHVRLSGRVETRLAAELVPGLVERVAGVVSVTSDVTWDGAGR